MKIINILLFQKLFKQRSNPHQVSYEDSPMKIVRLKVWISFSQSDDLAIHSRSQVRLKLDKCLTCTITAISRTVFISYGIQTWHDGRHMHGISAHAHAGGLDLDERSHWVGKGKKSVLNHFDN